MNALFRLLAGLCLIACATSVRAELSPVSFVVSKQHFRSGDLVVIEQVLASSPTLDVGTKIVVRGHYQLTSTATATLGLFTTRRAPVPDDSVVASQVKRTDGATGSFELSCEIRQAGNPHVSFYPVAGGESFGGVYFSISKSEP